MRKREIDRRQFLKRATLISAGVIGFPCFVRSAALGKDGGIIGAAGEVFKYLNKTVESIQHIR